MAKHVDQARLKEIRDSLEKEFSFFQNTFAVSGYVEEKMREYTFPGLYTDGRCQEVEQKAAAYIQEHVKKSYERIADEILDYVIELESVFTGDQANHEYGSNNIGRAVIGASIGLGAAVIFGGPIGWAIGVGAVIGGLFSSYEKKNALIEAIINDAKRINEDAMNRLLDVLDKLILPDPVLLMPPFEQGEPEEIIDAEILSQEQAAIKRFLEERGIKYLVHFSDAANAESIAAFGILSRSEAHRRNVPIKINDHNDFMNYDTREALSSDVEDYVSLSITHLNERVLAAYRSRGELKRVHVYYIDASILWEEPYHDRVYCNINASSAGVRFGKGIDDLASLFADHIDQIRHLDGVKVPYDREGLESDTPTHPQAEILFEKAVDTKYIIKIEEL